MSSQHIPGLQGVVAARTRLSSVDGERGELIIAGFPVEELAARATFEQAAFLLLHDRLPSSTELSAFTAQLVALRALPVATRSVLESAARQKTPVIDALRMAAGTLSIANENEPLTAGPYRDALACIARFPTIVANYWRLFSASESGTVPPHHGLSHSANYLYMLRGTYATAAEARAMDTYLNTVIDHGLNASTFTARVIASTESDVVSAVTGAIGALKGPLHGGAPGPALEMVFEIGTADRADTVIRGKLERGERLMGFGHRVYKVRDPRADVLSREAERLYAAAGDRHLYDLAREVEKASLRLLDEYKPQRHIRTNVEFFTALLLQGLRIPVEIFTPTFAVARVVGWTAHALEQLALPRAGRLIRPQSEYIGARDRSWE